VKVASLPANEAERLRALERYRILDTAPEAAFDDLTHLASQLCGTPRALVSFVDERRAWSKAQAGWELAETPREWSFSAHAILGSDLFVVEDAGADERFADNPLVTRPPWVRFFAGAPLINPQGFALGTLCVVDSVPRQLTARQLDALKVLAHQVVTQLELRLHVAELEREAGEHQRTEAALRAAEGKYRSIFENAGEGIFQTTADGHYLAANPALARIYGFGSSEELIAYFTNVADELYVDPNRRADFVRLLEQDDVISMFESQVYRPDGSVIWISENARAVRDAEGKLLYYEGTVEDITERKRAEETLRRSEMRFRSIWENSADGMRLADGNGIILAVNSAYCEMVGMEEAELVGQPFTVVFADAEAEKRSRLEAFRQRFAERTIDPHMERRVTFHNGRQFEIELANSFVELETREPALLSILHDITERRRAEEALRESELLYHSLVEHLPQNIFRKDLNERFTFVNQRFCETLGRKRADIIGKTDFDFFPPELAEKYQKDDRRIMFTQQPFEQVEAHQTPDRGKIYVQVIKSPLRDAAGNVVGIQGIFWDVTERKRIEEQLQFERDLLRALLDNVPDRIYFKDTRSRFVQCSLAMAKRLGLDDPSQVVGKTDFDFHPQERAQEFFTDEQRILQTGVPLINKVERQLAHDGAEIWASVTKVPTRNPAGQITGLIGISRDITELKRAEKELAVTRDAALESARLKAEFLATMSHEIRTPMNGIMGMTGLLLDTDLTPEQRDFAETVRSSAEALLGIINDILDFSKIEAGKLRLEVIDFDLREAVESTMELLAHRAQVKGIELASLIPEEVPVFLRGDPGRLRQILVNLVGNAVKFTEAGEVVVRVAKESESEERVTVLFTVNDTGIGIPHDAQSRIFHAFTQADGSTTRKYGGTGLGLAICKQMIELMGGHIGVESEPGKGSTFWFSLPLEKQAASAARQPEARATLEGVRVLIVDDNATNRQILQHQTTGWGMISQSAASAEAALTALRAAVAAGQPFQLVISDMQMPQMDGLMLARAIRADAALAGARFVILTSLGQRLEQPLMDAAGIAACLLKPVKQARLFEALAAALAAAPGAVASATQALADSAAPEAQPPLGAFRPLRVLLAEDNSVNQKVALLQLRKLGHTADSVGNGVEVLEAIKRVPYDVVLLDCQMPVLDGFQAAHSIRQSEQEAAAAGPHRPPLHIVAMTANALAGDREQCLAAGMNDYLIKPVRLPDLERVLRRSIDRPVPPAASSGSDAAPVLDLSILETLRDLREDGQPDPVGELIDLFLHDAPERLRRMCVALQRRDATGLYAAAHSLKGSASNLGARSLAALCVQVERAARSESLDGAVGLLEQVRAELGHLEAELQKEKAP
jgi:PAS domain S-box-containing protein